MKLFFFTKGEKSVPSSRYRAYYIAEELNKLGYEATVIPVKDRSVVAFFKYLFFLWRIKSDDVLYLQRTIYNKFFLLAVLCARLFGRRFIFDIDDAVYEHSKLKTKLLTRYADFVTCGSEKIKKWTILHNKKCFVVENSIPLSVYTERKHEPNEPFVIGWIGTFPERLMKPVVPALEKLVANGVQFNFKVIGAMGNPEIKNLLKNIPNVTIIDSLDWSNPSEAVSEIKKFNIGIMPLTTSEWDQVRYFKVLEYMACGVPVVATSTVTISAIVEKAGCGFAVKDTDEWVKGISELISDKSLRKKMGDSGREYVVKTYSTTVRAKELLKLIADNK